jgi:hypothetical protein
MTHLDELESETQLSPDDFDPDADYARPAPPVPDGWYFARVSNAGVKIKNQDSLAPYRTSKWKNEQKEHFEIAVKAVIIKLDDPLVDSKTVYQDRPLRTAVDPDRGNTSPVAAAFRALAGEPIKGLSESSHTKQLLELLKSEPTSWIRIQNILRDTDAEIAAANNGGKDRPKAVYGQKKIMSLVGGKDTRGQFTGVGVHPTTGTRLVARPRIVEFSHSDPADRSKK